MFDNVLDERNEPGWTATQVNNNYKMYYNYKCIIFTNASIYVQHIILYVHTCQGFPNPHTSQNSHLLLYPSLWLLVPGPSSQFLQYILYATCFNVSNTLFGNIR